jgi:hypothetical protein
LLLPEFVIGPATDRGADERCTSFRIADDGEKLTDAAAKANMKVRTGVPAIIGQDTPCQDYWIEPAIS